MLVGGEPVRIVRLTAEGARRLRAGDAGALERLAESGLAHRIPRPGELGGRRPEVVVVVPVRDDSCRLERLLGALAVSSRPGDPVPRTVVVDDGSHPPLPAGVADVRLDPGRGPAAARNAARALLVGPAPPDLVCFLDADTFPPPGFLDCLLPHFADRAVGAVAPRVRAPSHADASSPPWLAAYERLHSPLDLGPAPAVVGVHRRVSYVPTAALVCRLEALEAVGWFDPDLEVGEDVELLRRLEEAGWTTRYEPSVVVEHDPRPDLAGLLTQRAGYGRSAAALDALHPGSVAPLSLTPAGARVLVAAAAIAAGPPQVRRLAAPALAAFLARTALALRAQLARAGVGHVEAVGEAVRLTAGLVTGTVAGVLAASRRAWWPLLALAAVAGGRRARRAALLLAGVAELTRQPRPASVPAWGLALLDDAAYGAGLWAGCLRARSAGALLPRRSRLKATPTAR